MASRVQLRPDRSGGSTWLPATGLALAGAIAFGRSLGVPFVFDDLAAIQHNATIRDFWAWDQVLVPPRDGSGVMGRPIVNLSLAFNYALGGLSPRGYHVFNVVLHVLTGLTLFGLVRRTLAQPRIANPLRVAAMPLAFCSALLWLVHPLQTESVICVIQRTEILVGFFYLLTLYAVARAASAPEGWRWSAVSVGACALGMASKEVMVSAPLMALLYDRTFLAGSFRAAWQTRRPLYFALGATWLVLALSLFTTGGARGQAAGFGLGVSSWHYLLTQCEALLTYLKLVFWPHPLVLDYGTDVVTDPWSVAPQGLALLALLGATVVALWRKPWLGFLGAWFFVLLAPSSSFVPLVAQTMAEHRMYLPLAAPLVVIACALFHRLPRHAPLLLGTAGIALAATTWSRHHVYQNEITLWADTVEKRPGNPRAHASLALALSESARPADAITHYQRALELDPKSVATHLNLGLAHFRLHQFEAAAAAFRRALELDPGFASGHNNLGAALLELGDLSGAQRHYREALRLDPQLAATRDNLARVSLLSGNFDEAVRLYREILVGQPASATAHYNLGLALARAGDVTGAKTLFEQALTLSPSALNRFRYGQFLFDAGDTAAAVENFRHALRLNPNLPDAHHALGVALLRLGRTDEAVAAFNETLRLQPDHPEAAKHLAAVRQVSPPP